MSEIIISHSLHRNALGEVTGLIHVATAADGDVIGQQLKRDHFEEG